MVLEPPPGNQTSYPPSVSETMFFRNPARDKLYIAMVIIGAFGVPIELLVGGTSGVGLLFGIIIGAVMLSGKGKPVLTFHDHFCEMKASPMAPLIFIRYLDITEVDRKPGKVVLRLNGKRNPFAIGLSLFAKEDREPVWETFTAVFKGKQSSE
jgi:hypothetical protein